MITEKENAMRVLSHEGSAWLPCMSDCLQIVPVSCAPDNFVDGRDWFGVMWRDGVPDPGELIMDGFEGWQDKVVFPDLDAIDWQGSASADCANIDRENKIIATIQNITLIERVNSFAGITETMLAFYQEPDELKSLLYAITEFRLKHIDKVVKHYDPDLMFFFDDYGSQKSLFMSPGTWREFFKDPLKKLVDRVHEHGKYFCMHSCGKIDDIIGDFVEIGIDMWDSVQSCCDYQSIFEKHGEKMAFMPMFDLQRFNTPDPGGVQEELHYIIDVLGGNGLLFPRDNASLLHPDNKEAVIAEIRKLGRGSYLATKGFL